jgi:hypothetical protein
LKYRRVKAYIDPRVLEAIGADRIYSLNKRGEEIWKWVPTFDQDRLHISLCNGGQYYWEEVESYSFTLANGKTEERKRYTALSKPAGGYLPFPPRDEPAFLADPGAQLAWRAEHYPALIKASAELLRRVAGV